MPMKHNMTRLRALTGLGSLITAAGCAGSPAVHSLLPGARGAAPGSARIDPSQFFRVTRRKVAPLNLPRYDKAKARTARSTTSYDPLSGTTVVSDGAGNGVWYDSEGEALMTIALSPLSDGSGSAITMTADDGTQCSSYIPTSNAFDGSGTTTVGALTMSSDPVSGLYVGNYQTDSGVFTVSSTQSALGDFTTTLPDGSTFTVPQAAVSGLIPTAHARRPQDITNPACIAAVAALVAAIIGLCLLFWYAVSIVTALAAKIAASAAVTGGVQLIGGSGIYGAICAAVIAVAGGAIALINTQCAPASPITLSPSTVTLQTGASTSITITQTNYYAQRFSASAITANGGCSVTTPAQGNIATVFAGNQPGTYQFAIGDVSGTSTQQAVLTVIVVGPSPSPAPTQAPTSAPASPSPAPPTAPPTRPPASPSPAPPTAPPTMPPASPSAMPTAPPTMPPSPRPSGM
jgi:hypothetical protein